MMKPLKIKAMNHSGGGLYTNISHSCGCLMLMTSGELFGYL